MSNETFTEQQRKDWLIYEKVRQSGKHNMLFPGARRASGLSEQRYTFVLTHYSELRQSIYPNQDHNHEHQT